MLKNKWLKLDIQFFADGDGAAGEGDSGGVGGEGDGKETDPVTLTPEELAKKIEAESDRKLASALAKKQAEWDAALVKKLEDAKAESERLAKLSEKERELEKLTQREKAADKREAELAKKELLADAIADLNEKKLPSSFAEVLLAENAEKTLENINAFKTAFDAAVADKVKEALRQDTPVAGGQSASIKHKGKSIGEMARAARIIK